MTWRSFARGGWRRAGRGALLAAALPLAVGVAPAAAQLPASEIVAGIRACALRKKLTPRHAYHQRYLNDDAWRCYEALYIRIAAGGTPEEAFRSELGRRLAELWPAHHRARETCGLTGSCGSMSFAFGEGIELLKWMILSEHALSGDPDPVVVELLNLRWLPDPETGK